MFDCSDVRGESGGGRGAQTGLARCEGDVQNADRSVNQLYIMRERERERERVALQSI